MYANHRYGLLPYLDALRYFALALSGKVVLALREKNGALALRTKKKCAYFALEIFFLFFLLEFNYFNFL
jgi:hypothetical protein